MVLSAPYLNSLDARRRSGATETMGQGTKAVLVTRASSSPRPVQLQRMLIRGSACRTRVTSTDSS